MESPVIDSYTMTVHKIMFPRTCQTECNKASTWISSWTKVKKRFLMYLRSFTTWCTLWWSIFSISLMGFQTTTETNWGEKSTLNVGGAIPWARVLDWIERRKQRLGIHCPQLPDCGYNVISQFLLQQPHLSFPVVLYPLWLSQNKPLFPQIHFL